MTKHIGPDLNGEIVGVAAYISWFETGSDMISLTTVVRAAG